ncbi:MAG TPA: alpha-ketoacid dehydrogenase subunit beta [Thermoleophilaceae bacterium]|nr:alpha-ketoacid dehydrogenase subunit beta [Thermoleophilaceae bacterium]
MTYKQAITLAMADALESDASVFMLGEDIGAAGGAFKTTEGLMDTFGAERVLDTPISEQAIIGAAIGAAIKGLRPIAELMFADFSAVCFDQIANQLAKYRYMTGGQVTVPVTIRLANGAGAGFGSQHSQSVENWFLNVPGLKIAVPGSPADAYGLLRAAVRDDDPVLYFEHKGMLNLKGDVDREREPLPLGQAAIVRAGSDVTVIATQLMRVRAEDAARALEADGLSVELIDPRTLAPLDMKTILQSVERTNRLVVVQESPPAGSWGATIVAKVVEAAFDSLDAPPVLLSADETPIPYAGALERAWMPDADRISSEIRRLLDGPR